MSKGRAQRLLVLTEQELKKLREIGGSKTLSYREVQRANILLDYYEGVIVSKICMRIGASRPTVQKCINKALQMGFKDLPHSPKRAGISLEAKAWVVHIACTQPKNMGLAAEIWSRQSLANYVRKHAEGAGHSCLNKAAAVTIHRILKEHDLQPHKVKYYLERRDPDFERKMEEVLLVYQEVNLINAGKEKSELPGVITVCLDEKPGVQAIVNTSADLASKLGRHSAISRDYEYKRQGTASILAGIDLHDGHVFAQVHRRHRSSEFIELLKEIDEYYPQDKVIRLVLDNHSAHTAKETRSYLASRPGRFVYVHTPTHGSWLNLAETLFSKMARTFLKYIRVKSWDDLKNRILTGVAEINAAPVVHKWNKFGDLKCNV